MDEFRPTAIPRAEGCTRTNAHGPRQNCKSNYMERYGDAWWI